ncbi:sushi, von Willebrand factor type A, EGF and pentraxin domain-containing protein 1-like isoform X2 [Halichondria panicea]|uniref:sushi, von Willebrand factor type A, EGF and pentraxin domain-containing protein 1-like isoform X2 n=1 Tax=Halichondria panicea TaxID=6063 RepID=UPI00312B7FAC
MAYTSFLKYAIFATLMLFMSTASGEHVDVCTRTLYRRASTLTSISESYSVAYSYYIACGWWGVQRCRRTGYSPAYRTAYKTVYYSEDYDQCCSGYIGTAPHCQRVCLSLPSYVSHGTVIVNSTFVGGTAVYSCSPGYRVDGAAVLTCQSDSSWNNQVPTCRRVCSVLDGIADGAVSKTDGDFVGSEASYSCSYGYGLVGGSTLTCLNRGEWNGSPPTCHKLITCLRPDDPTNGSVTWKSVHNEALVGSIVSYRCSAGYALVGSDSRTCQLNGTWTHSDPQCQRICPTLRAPRNGDMNVSDYFVAGTAKFACNVGFEIVGSGKIICEADGLWSQPPPVCDPVCSVLTKPDNGIIVSDGPYFIESNATFTCEDGFGVNGDGSITCLSDLTWSGSSPTCDRVCGPLKQVLNSTLTVDSYFFDGEATYQCNEGFIFKLSGSQTESHLTYCCLHDDNSDHLLEWVGDYDVVPDCERICPTTLRAPRNGDMTVSDYFVDGTAKFACNVGFEIVGSGQIICEADGLWSQQPPVCDPVCSVPTKPDNGIIVSDEPYFIESNATFACEDGFGVNGNGSITCLSDLTWSGSSPTCDRVCGPPQHVPNSTMTIDSYFYNGKATYQCKEGFNFKFSGPQTESRLTYCCLHAENSDHLLEWVGDHDDVPDCEPIECSTRRLRLRYGTVSITSHYYGGIVTYMCFDGYVLTGPQNRRCSKNRIWEPRINPFCTGVPGNCSINQ